jgi:hypothetical protein
LVTEDRILHYDMEEALAFVQGFTDFELKDWKIERFEIWSLRFEVWDSKFEVWDLKFEVWDLKFEIWDLKFEIWDWSEEWGVTDFWMVALISLWLCHADAGGIALTW